jgi:hypothetical protein
MFKKICTDKERSIINTESWGPVLSSPFDKQAISINAFR